MAVSVDVKCSPEGCWYCKHRCHSCFQHGSIGYNYKIPNGQQLYHCSERCYHMHTGDIADSIIYDIVVGNDFQSLPTSGTHLLLSATINLHTWLSKNTVVSTQLCVTYGHTNIPSGVVYLCVIFCTTETHLLPTTLYIDHTLSLIKSVWASSVPQDVVEKWREIALMKRALQPALDYLKCDDVCTFLKIHFPCLTFSFMDLEGRIYSLAPNGYIMATSNIIIHAVTLTNLFIIYSVKKYMLQRVYKVITSVPKTAFVIYNSSSFRLSN